MFVRGLWVWCGRAEALEQLDEVEEWGMLMVRMKVQ